MQGCRKGEGTGGVSSGRVSRGMARRHTASIRDAKIRHLVEMLGQAAELLARNGLGGFLGDSLSDRLACIAPKVDATMCDEPASQQCTLRRNVAEHSRRTQCAISQMSAKELKQTQRDGRACTSGPGCGEEDVYGCYFRDVLKKAGGAGEVGQTRATEEEQLAIGNDGGMITTQTKIDEIVRRVVAQIGFGSYNDDLSGVVENQRVQIEVLTRTCGTLLDRLTLLEDAELGSVLRAEAQVVLRSSRLTGRGSTDDDLFKPDQVQVSEPTDDAAGSADAVSLLTGCGVTDDDLFVPDQVMVSKSTDDVSSLTKCGEMQDGLFVPVQVEVSKPTDGVASSADIDSLLTGGGIMSDDLFKPNQVEVSKPTDDDEQQQSEALVYYAVGPLCSRGAPRVHWLAMLVGSWGIWSCTRTAWQPEAVEVQLTQFSLPPTPRPKRQGSRKKSNGYYHAELKKGNGYDHAECEVDIKHSKGNTEYTETVVARCEVLIKKHDHSEATACYYDDGSEIASGEVMLDTCVPF